MSNQQGWGGDPYPTLPMVPGTENNDPEVKLGPRVDTSGCPNCKAIEIAERAAYQNAYLNCNLQPNEPERKHCRKMAWIFYLDAVYGCFQSQGCFGA